MQLSINIRLIRTGKESTICVLLFSFYRDYGHTDLRGKSK